MTKAKSPSSPTHGQPYTPVYDANERDQLGYAQPPLGYRHPHWIDEDRTLLPILYTEDGHPVIDFTPVPQSRKRRIGWDPARQRAFVALLAHTPSIGFAARQVGLSPQSYYRLIEKPGAESFAKAVDLAIDHGLTQLRLTSLQRGLGEDRVPVFRRGRHVRTELRRNDRLAIAILRQSHADPDRIRHAAQLRWRNKREWAAMDAERARVAAELAAREAEYQSALAEFTKPRPRVPSVRQL